MSQSILFSNVNAVTRRIVLSLRMSELHSETEKKKRRIFDDVILQNLGYSVAKPAKPDSSNHVSCANSFHPDSVEFLDDNDPAMSDSTTVYEKPITEQWTHEELNLTQVGFCGNRKLIVELKTEMVM